MIKVIGITASLSLALGSIIGYLISELTRSPQNLQAQNTSAPVATASPKPLTRIDLEKRYIKALSGYRLTIDTKELKVFSDRQLNDEVYRLESLLRAGKAYTPPD